MKTMKSGVFAALTVVLLLAVALITSCPEPLGTGDFSVQQEGEGAQTNSAAPSEHTTNGAIYLNFGDSGSSNGRTIRPNMTLYDAVSKFSFFDVYFEDSSNVVTPFLNRTTTSVLGPYTLTTTGTYEVRVYAYTAPGGVSGTNTTAVAFGADTSVSVTSAGGTAEIDLAEIKDAVGNGTFNLALSQPASNAATGITMSIVPLTGGTSSVTGVSLSNAQLTTYTTSLLSGFYRVEITLSRTGGLTTIIREILHIYQGMTSTFTRQLPPVNTNEYTITYQYNDGATSNGTETITHGDAITGPASPSPDPSTTNFYAGHTWQGWYTEAGPSNWGTLAVLNTYKPVKTQTLYGRWQSSGVNITLGVDMSGNNSPQLSITGIVGMINNNDDTYSATVDRSSPPTNVVISVTNDDAYDSFSWSVSTTSQTSTDEYITLDFSTLDLMIAGDHVITVIAKIDSPVSYHNSTVTITVGD